ncbi:interferon-induced very large GTPase 1-like [Talpa occidentalis]|uniref:interferon-induced very large GTPase 1-like n=1 Tax=Talpa occidentalis TaxID=50954 RepID=UPI00188F12BE|nr:interferon-induced very large GTPase 1-like [Talpa occidentalis]
MATARINPEDPQLPGERGQELQDMLREVGLAAEYWLPQLQEHLGVTCAQALENLDAKDLRRLQAQAKYPWETRALEKLLNLSHSKRLPESQEAQVEMIRNQQKQAEQALQELRGLLSAGRQRQEEAVRSKEAELRQAMDIPKEYWPPPQTPLKEVVENMQRQLHLIEGTLSHRQNLPDRELLRRASRGLALQGIYKTSSARGLLEKREELLSVPTQFSLSGPEQGPCMETKEFTSSEDESTFTQTIEKLGFSVTAKAKGGGWGFSLEAGTDHSKHSDSKATGQSHSQHSYFCSTKFSYVPLASCHFPLDQLQFSKAALQELHCIEGLLGQPAGPDRLRQRDRAEAFFQRFGSHANQGPLHLGGIYWWKATAEGFQSEQLAEVKQQAAEALDSYIRGSYRGFGVQGATGVDVSASHSKAASQKNTFQSLQTRVQLSTAQTGGPPEANGLIQWKAGLVASNQTWCVIDRGLQLVPVWDIILSSHRSDFKDPLPIAKFLKECYAALTGLPAHIQDGEESLSAGAEARALLEHVTSWEVANPEEQLKRLIDFMQMLNEKVRSYDTWINICLTDGGLQNFLLNTVNHCKNVSTYNTKFVKSQLRILLHPHIYSVTNFPQAHSIMQWLFQPESAQEHVNISQFSELIKILKEAQNHLMEVKAESESLETVEEVQRKATYEVSLALGCFLNKLQENEQPDIQVLLLCIAMGAGYHAENKTFQYILGYKQLDFLVNEMQRAHKQYQEHKSTCSYRAHAFLVLTGLTATAGVTTLSPQEKIQRLELIRQQLGQSLPEEVAHVLTKYGAFHDCKNLEKDLKLLIDGDYEATRSPLQGIEVMKQLQNIFHEKNPPQESQENEINKWEVTENRPLLELLQRLGLELYYPKRMSRANFHLIYKASVNNTQPSSEQDLPFYFLQKLLMLDYGLRYLVFKDDGNTEMQDCPSTTSHENEAFDPYADLFEDSEGPTSSLDPTRRPHIHPMDIQMAILHCADDFARQYILGKLAICQFALPLLIPNPCTSQIEFSLWSLSQIRKTWKQSRTSATEKSNYRNQQMSRVSTPIVSFIRVGNGLSASKSQIMNCLVSKRKHDVFFHRHCRGSTKDCLLMGGVVEICWFCPGGEEEDRFHTCLTFTNLHGDAKEHQEQLTFLQKVSSLLVVLMSTNDGNNKENRKTVNDLCQSSKPLIFLLDDKEKIIGSKSAQRVKIGIRNRNEAELTEELATTIQDLLERSDAVLSLQACAQIARQQGFLIDEDQRDCKEAKEKAETLMALLREMQISQMKENLLPLQGQLWHLWCKKDKELYHLREKGNRSIEQHKSEIQKEKQRIRQQQLNRAFPLNDLMGSTLEILHMYSETHTKLYFLQWMSVFLDGITAGHLEILNKKKKTLWSQIQTEKQTVPKSSYLKDWECKIEALSRKINDCSLGIEQLLREVGQIYEALEEASSTKDNLFLCFPQIAANLMIAGVPIELMDGDASYVPLKWVAAVFDKVSEKLGDKRLFVLSVLGLQSSGKSTLLNALFGLQFTVSAGRCTRGAYMQLLRVEETFTEELGFDFVLVVDTEGLRAPELNNKSQNRDNELATFVIGLANLTLINIFGENPSEMQDILQIVVQAFLRMKQVKISPSCLFVHQNVGEVTAEDQTMEGRRRLEQRLDEMAATAAEQEQCSDVTRFSDVIKFDVNTQVCYFAHLWDGNPPMAPPNPRYSHNIQDLKSRILLTAQQEARGSIMKISDVKLRVQDLWRALVSENFIFSFRNTQEVMAMSKLETMYNSWTWELRSHVLGVQDKLINQIQNGKTKILMTEELHVPVAAKYEVIKQEFEKYFNEDPDSEILVQWKANFENKLIILKEKLILESERKVNELISFKKSQEKLDNKKSSYEMELLKRSRELALTVKGQQLSEKELCEKFNELWQKWVSEVSSTLQPIPEPEIDVDAENILLQHFRKEKNVVNILKENSGRKKFQIDHDKHVKMKGFFGFAKHLNVEDEESIYVTTACIVSRYEETISHIRKQQHDYNSSYFHEILTIMEQGVQSVPTKEIYTFTSRYKMDLSSSLFQNASIEFKEIHRAFKRANDPVNYLESKKNDFFMSFKISCQGATSIKTFVDFLWNKLTPAVLTTIHGLMVRDISGDIRATCSAFNGNRANLEKHVLISLAEDENFDNYWQYLRDPQSFFRNYIESHIQRYCSDKESNKVKDMLKLRLDEIKNTILSAIHKSIEIAKDKGSTVSEWLDMFCDQLSEKLILPRKDLVGIEHQEIKDNDFLKEAMSEALDPAMKTVEQKCLSKSVEEMVPEITEKLSEHLCGCWKQCPSCGAICTNTIPAHEGDHSVPFHRPSAVKGRIWHKTDHFVIESCTTSVASDCTIVFPDGREIPWKTYRLAGGDYATWSITPDSSSQPYWKWFVCHFRSELQERYKKKFAGRGEIPDDWTKITKQDVLNDLKT